MPDIQILSAKVAQPIACKCGHRIALGDIRAMGERVEIVCTACHASVVEIECLAPESDRW